MNARRKPSDNFQDVFLSFIFLELVKAIELILQGNGNEKKCLSILGKLMIASTNVFYTLCIVLNVLCNRIDHFTKYLLSGNCKTITRQIQSLEKLSFLILKIFFLLTETCYRVVSESFNDSCCLLW